MNCSQLARSKQFDFSRVRAIFCRRKTRKTSALGLDKRFLAHPVDETQRHLYQQRTHCQTDNVSVFFECRNSNLVYTKILYIRLFGILQLLAFAYGCSERSAFAELLALYRYRKHIDRHIDKRSKCSKAHRSLSLGVD